MTRFLAVACCVALAALTAACTKEGKPAGEAGLSWQSIESLPDFSGWWEWQYTDDYRARGPDGKPQGLPQIMIKAPLKPEIIRTIAGALAGVETRTSDRQEVFGAATACLPPYFLGTNGNPFILFEILFTPGRVTIADEAGLIRRVDIGTPMPPMPVESNAGTSVGHWEGDILVVETAGISRNRTFFIGPHLIGKDIHVLERFQLKEPDLLEVSVEMTAPELLDGPFKDTFLYKRRRDHRFIDESFCAESDRSIDHKARKEQLDLTPPEDLPPPPPG